MGLCALLSSLSQLEREGRSISILLRDSHLKMAAQKDSCHFLSLPYPGPRQNTHWM